jgi:hypothetical protein
MLSDQLCQLWVASADLLKDWLEHLWLLLDDLAELLELGVITEEIKVAKSTSACSGCCCSSGSEKISCSSTSGCTAASCTSLSCGLEKIDWLLTTFSTCGSRRSGGRRTPSLTTSSGCGLSLFLLQTFWDALKRN